MSPREFWCVRLKTELGAKAARRSYQKKYTVMAPMATRKLPDWWSRMWHTVCRIKVVKGIFLRQKKYASAESRPMKMKMPPVI